MSSPFKTALDEQLWFFLKEDMNLPTFVQHQYTFADLRRNGIKLESVLTILNVKDEVQKFAFYLHSASMAAAVRLLSDESILVTYNLYCQKDDVVTILVRGINEHSPNTSRSPSHQNSLRERRKISRGALVPEIFIQPTPRHASGTIDVSTMEEIEDESKMVTLDLGNGDFVTFTKEYLICKKSPALICIFLANTNSRLDHFSTRRRKTSHRHRRTILRPQ
jgi:hypothetical protein